MKKIQLFITLICSLSAFSTFSQPITISDVERVSLSFIGDSYKIDSIKTYTNDEGDTLFYIVNTTPAGYAIVSANEQMPPIIGWSRSSIFKASPYFMPIVKDYYLSFYEVATEKFTARQKEEVRTTWNNLRNNKFDNPRVQCWPEAGSTETEGWVETRWTQTSPYNLFCPLDPISNLRSYAGCPAVVMAQILNYLNTTKSTRFNDSDDYIHNYPNRIYNIDDDAELMGFPSFPELNILLDTIDSRFASDRKLSDSLAAALIFAAGTACTQVYTSEGSGTFAVNQANNAYLRFGFNNCELFETANTAMYTTLIENLKNGYPAHLALVDAEWSTGHNVIVDGYRDDNFFHINFGWGGQCDGWWLVPDPSFPYSLCVLEGIVVNIIPNPAGISNNTSNSQLIIAPNPTKDTIYLSAFQNQQLPYSIFNINGQIVQNGITNGPIDVSNLEDGTYILSLQTKNGKQSGKFIVFSNR